MFNVKVEYVIYVAGRMLTALIWYENDSTCVLDGVFWYYHSDKKIDISGLFMT